MIPPIRPSVNDLVRRLRRIRRGLRPASLAGGMQRVGAAALDAALPQTCIACHDPVSGEGPIICNHCHELIEQIRRRPYCRRCGRTVPTTAIRVENCARCAKERFWNVAGIARVSVYETLTRQMLLDLKYGGQERIGEYLADRLTAEIRDRGWAESLDALVPVPMHWLRRLQRPCDHARVLTEHLSRLLGVPMVPLVRRPKHSISQTRMPGRQQRFENVRGCFALPPRHKGNVAGKSVCIVDNLIVAGATIFEVSKVLRKAGAQRIYAAVVARPPCPGDPVANPLAAAASYEL